MMDQKGEQLAALERYTDAGGVRSTLDLSRFACRTVYLRFFVEPDQLFTTAFYLDRVALKKGDRP